MSWIAATSVSVFIAQQTPARHTHRRGESQFCVYGQVKLRRLLDAGRFDLIGDVAFAHAGTVSTSDDDLTLSTFTVGGRYLPRLGHSSLQPFGQVLIGLAHSSGTLVQGSNPGAANAGAAFAGNFGSGLDWRATRRFSIRLVEADYLLTTVDNGSNNHQNNPRISAGVVIHF